MRILLVISILLATLAQRAWGQTAGTPALERTLSLQVHNEPLEEVLKLISKKAQVVFSFNPERVDVQRRVSISVHNKSIRSILELLFRNYPVEYKQRKQYIILSPLNAKASTPRTISGYIYALADSSRLGESTIFDRTHQQAVLTDDYGHFSITLPSDARSAQIKISKQNFQDTIVQWEEPRNKELDIYLRPQYRLTPLSSYPPNDTALRPMKLPVPDSMKAPLGGFLSRWFLNSKLKANMRNLKDTVFANVQLSLVPYVSSNRLLTTNTVNKVSFNLLAGYSNGVRIAEVGGLFNIDKGSVRYAQVAGLGNVVRDSMIGAQVAAVYNRNGDYTRGAQVAGLFNNSHGTLWGAQIAGLINRTHSVKGAQVAGWMNFDHSIAGGQIAGLSNFCKTVEGVQIAGWTNFDSSLAGAQIAGLANFSKHVRGAQAAGLYNNAKKLEGLQIAGLYNIADSMAGGAQLAGIFNHGDRVQVQIAALFNYAKNLRGVQIGLVNIADTATGIPIGLFSYVKKGYHKLELFGDEVLPTQIAFRSGVEKLHSIFSVGFQPFEHNYFLMGLGYGLGSSFRLSPKWCLSMDLSSQQLTRNGNFNTSANLQKLFVGPEFRVHKKFSVSLGPVFNVMVADPHSEDYTMAFHQLVPYTLNETTSANANTIVQCWIGGRVSLKFF